MKRVRKKPDRNVRRPSIKLDPETKKWELVFAVGRKAKHLCEVAFCTRDKEVDFRQRNGHLHSSSRRTCNCCRYRRWRANNPEKNAFKDLRTHAAERKIPFTLTYTQFLKVIAGTGYAQDHGQHKKRLTVDRIQSSAGYEFGNCRVIPKGHNSGKGNIERRAVEDDENEPW